LADCTKQIAQEELKLHLEDSSSMTEHLNMLVNECMADFPDDDNSVVAEYAARIAHTNITEKTQGGHLRCVNLNVSQ
jgi:hypothetical protein